MRNLFLLATILLTLTAGAARAEEFADEFTGNELDPSSFTVAKPAGYEFTVTGGELVLTKLEGTTSGYAYATFALTIKGDFDATVVAERTAATSGSVMGLLSSHLSPVGFTDIYFVGPGNLHSNMIVGPVNKPVSIAAPSATLTLRIRRTGDHLVHEYDAGSGFLVLNEHTDAAFAGPVQIAVFIGEEGGQPALAQAAFDDLAIEGDVFTVPCGNGVLEEGEECDDDSPAWKAGEFCDATCRILACGDTDGSGTINVSDALHALRTSVGTRTCDACICDVDSSGAPANVSDALRLLRRSVGLSVELVCPACA